MKKGILYGVGVGPGDPELLTFKAVHALGESDVIAVPRSGGAEHVALQIVDRYIKWKLILYCDMPMTRDKKTREEYHDKAADDICGLLDLGKKVAFITIGDPSIYSTYWYVHGRVAARGYETQIIPGVPSFCAAAAIAGQPLCQDKDLLHIIPASYSQSYTKAPLAGGKVLMKTGRGFLNVREWLRKHGELDRAVLVERCGMEGERIVTDLDQLDEPSGYFSIILVRGDEK